MTRYGLCFNLGGLFLVWHSSVCCEEEEVASQKGRISFQDSWGMKSPDCQRQGKVWQQSSQPQHLDRKLRKSTNTSADVLVIAVATASAHSDYI